MKPFVSERGVEELRGLRLRTVPPPTEGRPPIELLARVPSEECGCPEELWLADNIIYLIHMEEGRGHGEIFFFLGDQEGELAVNADSLDQLRTQMFHLHATMFSGTEGLTPVTFDDWMQKANELFPRGPLILSS